MKEFNFKKEQILWKEFLIWIINNKDNDENKYWLEIMKEYEYLDFDISFQEMMNSFNSDLQKQRWMGELEHFYEEEGVKNKKDRLNFLNCLGSAGVSIEHNFDDKLEQENKEYREKIAYENKKYPEHPPF